MPSLEGNTGDPGSLFPPLLANLCDRKQDTLLLTVPSAKSLSPEVSCPWASGVFFDKLGPRVGGLGLRDLRESGGESQRPQNANKPLINLKDASIHRVRSFI